MCICDGYIYKAYDETNHIRVCNALIGKQVPQRAVGAWARDILESRSTFRLDQEAQTRLVYRTKSLLQGAPAAPAIFNAALDDAAASFTNHWDKKGIGCQDQSKCKHQYHSLCRQLLDRDQTTFGTPIDVKHLVLNPQTIWLEQPSG